MGLQVGVDAYRKGWVAIVLNNGSFAEAQIAATFEGLLNTFIEVDVIAVDIPIGIGDIYPRPADLAARKYVGPRWRSVFLTPPRPVLEAPNYTAARQLARQQYDIGVSAQAYSLAPRILEVDEIGRRDPRIIEAHPEVSFRAMSGSVLQHPKTSWNGLKHREKLLAGNGIILPADLTTAGVARPDDIADAAAVGWTAHRHAVGKGEQLPKVDQSADRDAAIWY